MQDVQTSFRMPIKLSREVEKLVKKGFYRDKTDLYLAGIRREISETKKLSSSVIDSRKARKQVWDKFMKKANGDFDKAFELMKKDAEKLYAKQPEFWTE